MSVAQPSIEDTAHAIAADRTGPSGIMQSTYDIDFQGSWTIDNFEALLGLAAYRYLAARGVHQCHGFLAAHVINGDPAILSYVMAVPVFAVVQRTTLRHELRNRHYCRNVRCFSHGRANGARADLALGAAGQSVYGSWSLGLSGGLALLALAMSVMVRPVPNIRHGD